MKMQTYIEIELQNVPRRRSPAIMPWNFQQPKPCPEFLENEVLNPQLPSK
jgi:hypothetical protein